MALRQSAQLQGVLKQQRKDAKKDGSLKKQYTEALNWCIHQKPIAKGAKAMQRVKGNGQPMWPLIDRSKVDRTVNNWITAERKKNLAAAPPSPDQSGTPPAPAPITPPTEPVEIPATKVPQSNAFLPEEIEQFVALLQVAAENRGPRNREKQRRLLRRILEIRHASTRPGPRAPNDPPFREDMTPLNVNAQKILASQTAPSAEFFRKFYSSTGPYSHLDVVEMEEKVVDTVDRSRDSACSWTTAKKHLSDLQHELMYLPSAELDEQGNSVLKEDGSPELVNCSPESAILNRDTLLYQSGDPVMYNMIEQLKKDVTMTASNASTIVRQANAAHPLEDGERTYSAAAARKVDIARELERAAIFFLQQAQSEDQRRGRARVVFHDEMPQFIQYGGGKGPARERCAVPKNTRAVQVQEENRDVRVECFVCRKAYIPGVHRMFWPPVPCRDCAAY